MKRGKLVIFCGPSGSGKGTIEKKFINEKKFNFHFSVSATTRKKRENEEDGKSYHFLSKETFEKWILEEKFLEWAKYTDNYYGTPIEPVEEMLSKGKNVFLEIEIIGVIEAINKIPDAITIFLSPPSIEVLEKRLTLRGTESKKEITLRMQRAKEEMKFANNKKIFKYNVINNDVNVVVEEIKDIISKEILL